MMYIYNMYLNNILILCIYYNRIKAIANLYVEAMATA